MPSPWNPQGHNSAKQGWKVVSVCTAGSTPWVSVEDSLLLMLGYITAFVTNNCSSTVCRDHHMTESHRGDRPRSLQRLYGQGHHKEGLRAGRLNWGWNPSLTFFFTFITKPQAAQERSHILHSSWPAGGWD